MKYMIHSCQDRYWYVKQFLVPSLLEQGIKKDNIIIYLDNTDDGNLKSCLKSFSLCKDVSLGTWHLQDDVIISKDFKQLTETYDNGIVCGFVNENIGPDINKVGKVKVRDMWLSFPCIRIPNKLALEFITWFNTKAVNNKDYKDRISRGKSDDWFFRRFLKDEYPTMEVLNLKPNLINHIDYLLGGSIANNYRKEKRMSYYWTENNLIDTLENKLNEQRRI